MVSITFATTTMQESHPVSFAQLPCHSFQSQCTLERPFGSTSVSYLADP